MLTKLRHQNIVSFIGACTIPGKLCIVTELMKMGSLDKILKDGKPVIKPVLRLQIALEVAQGMSFLHTCGIWHRDLKPENLLVESLAKNSRVHVKLTDFGSSRTAKERTEESSFTTGIGTPIYISPEILDQRVYNEKVDVYSYAILLLYLFTGVKPYKDFAHMWDVASFVTSGKRLPIPSNIPKPIQKIITTSWSQEASQRPSFQEIVTDLEPIVNKKIGNDTLQ